MTLERHRSKLIPDVDFSGEGRIFVTDGDGTFPLRHGKKPRDPLPKGMASNGLPVPPPDYDAASYHSYDPHRERDRKYKPQRRSNRYGEEVNNLTLGSSGSQSLQRKLRRLRGQGSIEGREGIVHLDPDHRVNRMGTWSSAGKDQKRRNREQQFPRSDGGYTGTMNSMQRKNFKRGSLDMEAIRGYKDRSNDRKSSILEMYNRSHRGYPSVSNGKMPLVAKQKRLSEDKLPGVLFLVCGLLMLALGATKILICYWHQYFCVLWTGLCLTALGISGATHGSDYLTKWRNGIYIVLGILSSLSVLACSGLLLQVIVPIVTELAMGHNATNITGMVEFSNFGRSLAIQLNDLEVMVRVNLAVDCTAFLLCLLGFFSLTATMVAVVNHWDAVYTVTGVCDHRGNPSVFNPFEQIALGQATILAGFFVSTLWKSTLYDHLWAPAWASCVVPIAGAFSLFFGRRPDSHILAVTALLLEAGAIAILTVAAVFVLLGLIDDMDKLQDDMIACNHRIASAIAEGIYTLFVLINLVFVIGIVFRIFRQVCCPTFLEPRGSKHGSRAGSRAGSKPPSLM